jgi:hypothetical protein
MITEPTRTNEPFVEFPKMARLTREVIVTEKIDGTNAQVYINDLGEMYVGSRSRWITAKTDNFGFHRWCSEHEEELRRLGPGHHFGEWWGSGVQRGYDLPKGEKRFSLFNVDRWYDTRIPHDTTKVSDGSMPAPPCCHVVPVLWRGVFSTDAIQHAVWNLNMTGSMASPGFMKPEGVVIFHVAGRVGFKKTIEKDESPKSVLSPLDEITTTVPLAEFKPDFIL